MKSSSSLALCGPPKITAPACPAMVSGSGSPKRGRRTSRGWPRSRRRRPTRPGVECSWCRTMRTGSLSASRRARFVMATSYSPWPQEPRARMMPYRPAQDVNASPAPPDRLCLHRLTRQKPDPEEPDRLGQERERGGRGGALQDVEFVLVLEARDDGGAERRGAG